MKIQVIYNLRNQYLRCKFHLTSQDMISKVKSTKLVEIFFYVSDAYEKELKFSCERFSNNNCPEFTDQEIMTVYLFCISQEQRSKIKYIYNFADEYLRSWKSIGYILEKDIVFIHRIIADSHGLNYYVKYPDGIIWKDPKLAGTDCFYLAAHGKPGGLKTPAKDIDSEELIAAFNGLIISNIL